MIEVVKSGKYVNGHSICERCGCEFKYTKEDVQHGQHVITTSKSRVSRDYDYVVCPECTHKIEISLTTTPENPMNRCTYVRDKNYVLIYEGDTVKTKYGRLAKIVWKSTPCFVGFDMEPLEWENPAPDAFDLWNSENLEVVV